jgi:hypothetical protein
MLSVIIPTLNSERPLVRTLAALVPGATAGLVKEVLIVDGGSSDDTAAAADVAGCNFLIATGSLGIRLKVGAAAARAPWLMFVRPGTILDGSWTGEVRHFVEQPTASERAAVFRGGASAQATWREAWSLLLRALGARPRPQQGLVISRGLYNRVGGHAEMSADPETELLRRLGRNRLVTLSTSAYAG